MYSYNRRIMQNIIRILHLYNKCNDCRINCDMYTVETLPQTGISVIRKDRNGSSIVFLCNIFQKDIYTFKIVYWTNT